MWFQSLILWAVVLSDDDCRIWMVLSLMGNILGLCAPDSHIGRNQMDRVVAVVVVAFEPLDRCGIVEIQSVIISTAVICCNFAGGSRGKLASFHQKQSCCKIKSQHTKPYHRLSCHPRHHSWQSPHTTKVLCCGFVAFTSRPGQSLQSRKRIR